MKRNNGFSLVELMVVVAVIAILAAVALPAYNDYVLRGKLTEAFTELSSMRVRLEQYYQDNRTYATACVPGAAPLPVGKYFAYSCPAATLTATTFTVQADGVGSTAGFQFTINQANAKATTGVPAGWNMNGACWVTKPSGTC